MVKAEGLDVLAERMKVLDTEQNENCKFHVSKLNRLIQRQSTGE